MCLCVCVHVFAVVWRHTHIIESIGTFYDTLTAVHLFPAAALNMKGSRFQDSKTDRLTVGLHGRPSPTV